MIPIFISNPKWQQLQSLYNKPEPGFEFNWMQEKHWNKQLILKCETAYIIQK